MIKESNRTRAIKRGYNTLVPSHVIKSPWIYNLSRRTRWSKTDIELHTPTNVVVKEDEMDDVWNYWNIWYNCFFICSSL